MSGPVFVITGDSHIGKGSHLYPERLAEQESAWAATLELAREREALAVLHAGDLFDKRRPTPAEVVAAVRPLVAHLEANGCRVDVIPGNHDPTCYGPSGLDVLDEAGVAFVHREPAVVRYGRPLGDTLARVAMLPWAPTSRLVAERGGRQGVNADAGELVLRIALDLFDECPPDLPRMLLGHWSVAGARLPNGLPVDRLAEPIVPADVLDVGFDAYAFGHIHRAGDIGDEQRAERAIYTGSPITLDHGEAGVEHGAWVYDTHEGTFELVDLGGRPFVTHTIEHALRVVVSECVVRVKDSVSAERGRELRLDEIRADLMRRGAVRVDFAIDVEREHKPLMSAVDTDRQPIHLLADYIGERLPDRVADDEHAERLLELAHTYLAGERALVGDMEGGN